MSPTPPRRDPYRGRHIEGRRRRSLCRALPRSLSLDTLKSQVVLPGAAAAVLVATATGAAAAHTLTEGSTSRAHALSASAQALEARQQSALRSDLVDRQAYAQRGARDQERQASQARAAAAKSAKEAAAARANRWVLPVANYRLSSNYGPRWGRLHAGIDFAAPVGTRLVAMHAGTVTFAGQQSGYGNKVEIRYTDGTVSYYGHMSSISVRQGQRVAAGQVVGRVGSTGHSTGPHLHLEIHPRAGGPVNPYPWLVAKGLRP
jgi:murein DD-endopeptidase MepM/ murein hydrolase activator NlpD